MTEKPTTELEAYKQIIDHSFDLVLNMNDAFHWACGDAEDLKADDVEDIVPICIKYGTGPTTLAYAAISRGYDSDHKKLLTSDYWNAKYELAMLADDGKIMFDRWYGLQEGVIEKSLFNGQEIVWKKTPERIWKLRARLCKDKSPYVVQMASLADGTWAIGGSISDTRNRLLRKYNAKHGIPMKQCEFPDNDPTKFCPRCGRIGQWGGKIGDVSPGGRDLECTWPQVKIPKEIDT